MTHYRIQHKTLTDLADRIRTLTGTSEPMTPAEMLELLQTVKGLTLGKAHCAAAIGPFSITASARGAAYRNDFGSATTIIAPAKLNMTSTLI